LQKQPPPLPPSLSDVYTTSKLHRLIHSADPTLPEVDVINGLLNATVRIQFEATTCSPHQPASTFTRPYASDANGSLKFRMS
jgi:hypothetical protein